MFKRKTKVILTRDQHNVSRNDIDRDALNVLYRLNRNNYTACLVGGAVRDLLLGRKPKDFDISTDAHPNKVRRLFSNCFLVGRRFRLAHIKFGNKTIECSTFRKKPEPVDATNDEEASLYLHHDNTFGTPKEDAERRDFTINGIFYDIESFKVIDYVGGCDDLKRKRIRTIGVPDVRFCEDPVRMLRAIRFASRLGFDIERRTWKSICRNHKEILKSAPARLYEELPKLFVYGAGTESVRLMKKAGLLADLMPGVSSYLSRSKDRGKLFWKCLEALDKHNAEESAPAIPLMYGALVYSMFKEAADGLQDGKARRKAMSAAMDIMSSISPDLPMPRDTFYQVVHMLNAQRYFEGWDSERFSKQHFVRQKSFRHAATLYEIILAATGKPVPERKPWLDLRNQQGVPEEGNERSPRRRRPRRRRRGYRRENPNSEDGSVAKESPRQE